MHTHLYPPNDFVLTSIFVINMTRLMSGDRNKCMEGLQTAAGLVEQNQENKVPL